MLVAGRRLRGVVNGTSTLGNRYEEHGGCEIIGPLPCYLILYQRLNRALMFRL